MRSLKLFLIAATVSVFVAAFGASSASAQIRTYYALGFGAPVFGPSPLVYAPPVVVARPIIIAQPVQVVPTYVAPAAAYSTYRPAYPVAPAVAPVPVYGPPAYGAVTRVRSGYIGPGLGGAPSVYTPGQPVRNAIRYVVP